LATPLLCLAAAWLGVQAAYPFVTAAHWRAANDDLERQVHRYHIQNQRDEKEIRMLDTRQGVISAARQLGYVEPNEVSMRVPADQR
jgi:hypothetical protein